MRTESEDDQLECQAVGEGFELFYAREHAPQVRRAALLVGSDELANDLVHDAFIEVYRRWGELDNPGGYLNRAVLNACRDEGRARPVRVRALRRLFEPFASDQPPDHLNDVLMALPFNQRAALVLRYYAGFTNDEIADHLNAAPGSIGPWIRRGLDRMGKVL